MKNIAADPLREREIKFAFKSEKYKARFRGKGVIAWEMFDDYGIVVSEKNNPEVWEYFYRKLEPEEIKSIRTF